MLTEEILEQRKSGLGGSDAAAACGVNPYKTRVDLYLEKVGMREPDDLSNSERVQFGNILEPFIADEYARRTGYNIENHPLVRHKDHSWMIANIDRLVTNGNEKFILECKNVSDFMRKEWGEPGSDEIPTSYLLQCAHYSFVFDVNRVDIAALFGGNKLEIFTYHKNKKLEENLFLTEKDFWENNVLKEVAPAPMTAKDIESLFPKDNGEEEIATDEVINAVRALNKIKYQYKALEEMEKENRVVITKAISEKSILKDIYGNVLATYKTQQANRLDTEKLKQNKADIYQAFLKTTQSRVLRVKDIL